MTLWATLIVLFDDTSHAMFQLSPLVHALMLLIVTVGMGRSRRWYAAALGLVALFVLGFGGGPLFALYAFAVLAVLVLILAFAVMHLTQKHWGQATIALLAVLVSIGYETAANRIGAAGLETRNLRLGCRNRLYRIGLALRSYHDDYRCFPAAVTTDGQGRPMHSWTVYLLPYLGEDGAADAYSAYNFQHAHDSIANSTVARMRISSFACPVADRRRSASGAGMTDYGMIVCEGGIGGVDRYVGLADVRDLHGSTVILAEMSQTTCPWTAPRAVVDLTQGLNVAGGASSGHPEGVRALTADGTVRTLSEKVASKETLRALSTIAGGERIDDWGY